MIRVITVENVRELIKKISLEKLFLKLIEQMKKDYARWDEFEKKPRVASHVKNGIIELMPICDQEYYAFKYVNGHPNNPKMHLQTVLATGQLSSVENGAPLLISEMTLLTAIRTAATSAMASEYLAKRGAKTFGIIGTGAQSEFQTLAHHFALGIRKIYYFDIDEKAMQKFEKNLKSYRLELVPCKDAKSVVEQSEIITTATAVKGHHKIIDLSWLKQGAHINGVGGDSPGKTELGLEVLKNHKVVVEFIEQSKVEGEIQLDPSVVYAELYEIVKGMKKGRESDDEITIFDSVGFALEDYSTLRLVYQLSEDYHVGHKLDMIPETKDPKDLFGVIL